MTFAIGERDSIREERSWELSPIQSMLTGPEYPIPEDTVKTMGKEPVEHMMYGTARVETAAYSIQQHTEDHMLSLGSEAKCCD